MARTFQKLTVAFFLIYATTFYVNAAFLKKVPQKITQPNGNTLECFATGDEFYNYLHDADGYTIIQNSETGFYVYADKIGDELVPTNLVYGTDKPEAMNLQKGNIISHEKYIEIRRPFDEQHKALFLEKENHRKKMGDQFQATKRTINNIIIFIEFADSSFTKNDLTACEKDYNTSDLSMKSYYNEVSYGLCTITAHFFPNYNDGKIYAFKSNRNRNYVLPMSAQNQEGYNGDAVRNRREIEMIRAAVTSIGNAIPSNLNVDTDNDGCVDAITIIFQGSPIFDYSARSGTALWPHKWIDGTSGNNPVRINGKAVYEYNILLEMGGSGMGVAIHEMGHVFGAPDLYTYETKVQPCGYWEQMSNDSEAPPHFSMYLKHKYFK